MRTCIVTREKLPKNQLMRLVRIKNDDGSFSVEVDLRGKLSGRGANIKPEISILETAFERGQIERALQLGRKLSEEEQEKLKQDFEAAVAEKNFRPQNKPVKLKVSAKEFSQLE